MKDNFFRWLFSESNRNIKLFYATAVALITMIGLVTPVSKFFKQVSQFLSTVDEGEMLNLNLVLHCIILFIIILSVKKIKISGEKLKENLNQIRNQFRFQNEEEVSIAVDRALSSEREFKKYWQGFWIGLLGLYVSWLFTESKLVVFKDIVLMENIKNVSAVFFNNLGSLFLLLCYITLSHPTHRKSGLDSAKFEINSTPYVVTTILLTVAHVLFLSTEGILTNSATNQIFTGISGLLFAITLSLVIGSLDSKFINSPSVLVAILYTYSAIQPFILMFSLNPIIHIAILYLGLILKMIFFLFVFWMTETKRLLFYFLEISQVFKFVSSNWDEIKKHLEDNK